MSEKNEDERGDFLKKLGIEVSDGMPYTTIWEDMLDQLQCNKPGCTHEHDNGPMFIEQRCHPGGPIEVFLEDGWMNVRCHVCSTPMMRVKVPPRPKGE